MKFKKLLMLPILMGVAFIPFQNNVVHADNENIRINLAAHTLTLYQGDIPINMYNIATGKPSTPTPQGSFSISYKEVNPTWIDPKSGQVIYSGESNPLGYRWLGLYGNYGIHGNNNPSSIGYNVSNGCIRMYEEDVEDLYDKVSVGTPVEIYYDRLVVEQTSDNQIVYYIYPDGYGYEPLSVDSVDDEINKLGYGINSFVSNETIEQKIYDSDGEPNYIGTVYNVWNNNKELEWKAYKPIGQNEVFVPAWDVAKLAKTNISWNPESQKISSFYGVVDGYDKKNILFVNIKDIVKLLHLNFYIDQSTGAYVIANLSNPAVIPEEPSLDVMQESRSLEMNEISRPQNIEINTDANYVLSQETHMDEFLSEQAKSLKLEEQGI